MNKIQLFNVLVEILNTYKSTIKHITVFNLKYKSLPIYSNLEINCFISNLEKRKKPNDINSIRFVIYDINNRVNVLTSLSKVSVIVFEVYNIDRSRDLHAKFYFNFNQNKIDIELYSKSSKLDSIRNEDVLNTDIHDSLKRVIIDNINLVRQTLS